MAFEYKFGKKKSENTVISNLNRQVELQNNLNDLIEKIQKNREKKD